MLENEYAEINKYTLLASKTIAQYYDRLEEDSLTDKDKQYIIEKILAQLDMVCVITMQIRNQIIEESQHAPGAMQIAFNKAKDDIKQTFETAKVMSYNFTAIYHGVRDNIKGAIE